MDAPSEPNPLYEPYHQVSSPTPAERERAGLEKAAARGVRGTGAVAPVQKIAQLEARLAVIEGLLKQLHGKNGIKVALPVISFTGKAGQSGEPANTERVLVAIEGIGHIADVAMTIVN